MKVPYKLFVTRRPPAPFKIWGQQALVRYVALRGFETRRPFVCRWKDNEDCWLFEHVTQGGVSFNRGLYVPG